MHTLAKTIRALDQKPPHTRNAFGTLNRGLLPAPEPPCVEALVSNRRIPTSEAAVLVRRCGGWRITPIEANVRGMGGLE